MVQRQPLVIAHRGASGHAPENTHKAFELAHQMGADGLELDVFLTKDNQLVVTHDRDTKRLTGTPLDVCDSTLKELKELDFGDHQKIPTLAEVLEAYLGVFKIINIEIKSMGFRNNGVEAAIQKMVQSFDCKEKIMISSFNPLQLWRMKRLDESLKLGYLVCPEQTIFMRNRWIIDKIGAYGLNLDHQMQSSQKWRWYFERPEPKWVWTVNDDVDLRFWVDFGVEAIMTNYPDRLKCELSR